MPPAAHMFQLYRPAEERTVWWRLISPNGRSLARAPHAFASPGEARASIQRLVALLPVGVIAIRPAPNGRWSWSISVGDEVLVRSAIDQDRRVRCEQSARYFVDLAGVCPVDEELHVFRVRVDHAPAVRVVR